jgi:hypothetical protein
MMIVLMMAAAVIAAASQADALKAIDLHAVCRENSFPAARRDGASIEAAKVAYVRKHGGTAAARREIEVACVLYGLAFEDGEDRAFEVHKALKPGVTDAIERQMERELGRDSATTRSPR